MTIEELRSRFRQLVMGGSSNEPPFSTFRPADAEQADALFGRFETVADTAEDEAAGVEAVIREALRLRTLPTVSGGAVRHGLLLFATHHPRGATLSIPPLAARDPERAFRDPSATLASTGPEAALDWWREDIFYNEHHEHWHIVYPARRERARQGELFLYMHQQMLARYGAERLASVLGAVQPLDDYAAPTDERYEPGIPGFGDRPAGVFMSPGDRADLDLKRLAVERALEDRVATLRGGVTVPLRGDTTPEALAAINAFGVVVEASAGAADTYGLHNNGHVALAALTDPGQPDGVMTSTVTAVRDPIFYRWHRHIDDLGARLQDTFPPHPFDDTPPVEIRGRAEDPDEVSDLLLVRADDVPAWHPETVDGVAWAEATFGGAKWDIDFRETTPGTNELITARHQQQLGVPGPVPSFQYLSHEDFAWVLRVRNRSAVEQVVTVRIFLAPVAFADDRRRWIEMDRFVDRIPALARKVIFRPANRSAVVRKRQGVALLPPRPLTEEDRATGALSGGYCECGWPYSLLLPRGTDAGLPVRWFVMLTGDDRVPEVASDIACGSLAMCGVRRPGGAIYPDAREMGYPFNRPFGGRTLAQIVAAQANMATRDAVIRFDPTLVFDP